jgi:uncharacterized repeat protein (TIGR01451 family)
MHVRLSVPRTLLVLFLLLLMFLSGISASTLAAPTALSSVTSAARLPGEAGHLTEAQNASQPISTTSGALQAPPSDDSELTEESKQGVVTIDVDVESTFKAGDVVTYTYSYKNTGTEVINDIAIDVTWSRFDTRVNDGGQYCYPDPTTCVISDGVGSAVNLDVDAGLDQDVLDGLRVLIDQLEPDEFGQFSISLRTGLNLLPLSGKPTVDQLDSSGALYINFEPGISESISEASTSTTAVGPRFSVAKQNAIDMPSFIFAGDEHTFVLSVGNGTAPADQTGEGQPSADIIDATNVQVRDFVPSGSTFITPTDGYEYDFVYNAEEGYIDWYIPKIAIGERSNDIPITFRKLDTNDDCGRLNNAQSWVTSDEMPINDNGDQRLIPGQSAAVPLVTPLSLQHAYVPGRLEVDEVSEATFTIINQYPRDDLQDVQVIYEIPTTVQYVPDSATPEPSAIDVVEGEAGGVITWTLDIAAAEVLEGVIQPVETTLALQLTAVTAGNPANGQLSFALDQVQPDIPTACIQPLRNAGPQVISELIPLTFSKTLLPELNPELQTDPGGTALIKDGDILTYTLQLSAPQDVPNIDITDTFPSQPNAGFELDSIAYLGDTPAPVVAEDGKSMIWEQQSLQANEPISFTYRVQVRGGEYVRSCNRASITFVPEDVQRPGDVQACYEIRPEIQVTKEADTDTALPGETVSYTLTLTNDWDEAREVELIDILGGGLVFESATSPDLGDGTLMNDTGLISWTARLIQPGETVQAFVKAQIPEGVTRAQFRNDVLFRYIYSPTGEWRDSPGNRRATFNVMRPSTDDRVEYWQSVAGERGNFTGLQSEVTYRLFLKNWHGLDVAENVSTTYILPAGFTYQRMVEANNLISTAPEIDTSRPDGRVVLHWDNIDIPPPEQTVEIRFVARTGATVGAKEGWLVASTDSAEVNCYPVAGPESCRLDNSNTYATAQIEIRALHTLRPRAVDPLPACLAVDEKLNYRISFVNNSPRTYVDTTLAITLPTSLSYSGQYSGVEEAPQVTTLDQGSLITWNGLEILPGQQDIDLELDVVEVRSSFMIQISASSETGLIPPENQTGIFLVDPCAERNSFPVYLPYIVR